MTPVLALPSSLGTTTELWAANAGHWSRTFRLLRYNQRGRDSVEELGRDFVRLLDENGLDRVSLCGLSLGGATAMWVAANAPERIDRLVLACTSARFGEPGPWLERAALVRDHGLEPIADGIVARWFTPAARPEVVARFRQMLVDTPPEDYAACCEALARWDFRDRLADIRTPDTRPRGQPRIRRLRSTMPSCSRAGSRTQSSSSSPPPPTWRTSSRRRRSRSTSPSIWLPWRLHDRPLRRGNADPP